MKQHPNDEDYFTSDSKGRSHLSSDVEDSIMAVIIDLIFALTGNRGGVTKVQNFTECDLIDPVNDIAVVETTLRKRSAECFACLTSTKRQFF